MNRESERTALLRAILEQPDCDTVRGAFADWLDENGESERAEFIRAQISAANGTVLESLKLWTLLHGSEWFADLCSVMGFESRHWGVRPDESVHYEHKNCSGEFFVRRGFVSEIALPCADFMAHAADIFAAHPVTSVKLTDKEPHQMNDEAFYWWQYPNDNNELVTELPKELHIGIRGGGELNKTFTSLAGANNALSLVCVSYGRSLASLPPYSPLPVKAVRL